MQTAASILDKLKKLDAEEQQLLAAQATVDEQIDRLLAEEEDVVSNRRLITSFELANDRLLVPWSDPAELPKRKTTYDLALAELSQEHPPVKPGTLQIHGGATYRFDGTWVLVQ